MSDSIAARLGERHPPPTGIRELIRGVTVTDDPACNRIGFTFKRSR